MQQQQQQQLPGKGYDVLQTVDKEAKAWLATRNHHSFEAYLQDTRRELSTKPFSIPPIKTTFPSPSSQTIESIQAWITMAARHVESISPNLAEQVSRQERDLQNVQERMDEFHMALDRWLRLIHVELDNIAAAKRSVYRSVGTIFDHYVPTLSEGPTVTLRVPSTHIAVSSDKLALENALHVRDVTYSTYLQQTQHIQHAARQKYDQIQNAVAKYNAQRDVILVPYERLLVHSALDRAKTLLQMYHTQHARLKNLRAEYDAMSRKIDKTNNDLRDYKSDPQTRARKTRIGKLEHSLEQQEEKQAAIGKEIDDLQNDLVDTENEYLQIVFPTEQ